MVKKLLIVLALFIMASGAQAQVGIGSSQMDAWRQMRGFGLHFDSVIVDGRVRTYTADSIRIAGLLNHVTVDLDDSQRVNRMLFDARDIDTATFADKYQLVLISPKITRRTDDGNLLTLRLEHERSITDLIYDRKERHISSVESPR